MQCDLVLRNGFVFDGFSQGKSIDVAVRDGRIAALGPNLKISAAREFDASGLWITPGFVDIHTHYDLEVEVAPSLSESVRHGVTSIVMGGCSLSTTFGDPEDLAHIFSRVETLPAELISGWLKSAQAWSSPQQYFRHLKHLPLGPNVASMLGHSALRVKVMGLERSLAGHATADEIETMKQLAEEALESGCIGISVDMVHWHKVSGPFAGRALPSHHASFAEYKMLADVCRERNAVFQVTPNPQNLWSLVDILRLSPGVWRAPLRNTILSALDMDGAPHLWRIFSVLLFICNQLLGCNIRFQTLAEPFVIYADGYLTPFFEEFSGGVKLNNCKTKQERAALWSDPAFCLEFEKSWLGGFPRTFHRDLDRMTIVSAPDPTLNGKSIAQAARSVGADPLQFFMQLLQKYDQELRWVACNANARASVRQKLMSHPHIFPGFSDAGAHSRNLAFYDSALSVIRQSVETGFLPIEKAIARVTSEPACWFNLDTGCIKLGGRADLTILNPAKLREPIPAATTVEDPAFDGAARMVKRDPDPAVNQVYIRGVEVVRDGTPLPVLASQQHGEVLTQVNPTRSQQEALHVFRNRLADNGALALKLESSAAFNSDVFFKSDASSASLNSNAAFRANAPLKSNSASSSDAVFEADGVLASIERYWPVFLLKHQHPANVAVHCFAFVLMYAIPMLALATKNAWLLLFFPLSQSTGLIGHWLFERTPIDQRDTVFSWRAFASLHLMFICVLFGRYGSELARAQNKSTLVQQA